MKILAACFCLCAMPLLSQSNSGELHLKVIDPSGRGVRSIVTIVSEANQYRNTLATGDQGTLDVRRLPYGIYEIEIQQPGFAAVSTSVGIHSSLPAEETIGLHLSPVTQSITVNASNTLIESGSGRLGESDWVRLHRGPGRLCAGPLYAGPGQLAAGLAL